MGKYEKYEIFYNERNMRFFIMKKKIHCNDEGILIHIGIKYSKFIHDLKG